MSTLLTTLPGDIQGLLLRGSPVVIDFWRAHCHDLEATGDPDLDGRPEDFQCRGVIASVDDGVFFAAWLSSEGEDGGADDIHQDWMILDLTDRTGRAHAAWWLMDRWRAGPRLSTEDRNLILSFCRFAEQGADMTPEQIDALARLVLRLAGRTP